MKVFNVSSLHRNTYQIEKAHLVLLLMFIYTIVNIAAIWRLNIGETFDAWLELHQVYYQSAIFLGFFALFSTSTWIFVYALLLGFLAQYFGLFDEILHTAFADFGFYRLIGFPGFASNPQYAKLIFYALALVVLGSKYLFKKNRTLKVAFILIVMCVNLMVVGLNHKMLPTGFMKDLVMERLAYLKSFTSKTGVELIQACSIVDIYCEVDQDPKLVSVTEIDEKGKKYLQQFADLNLVPGMPIEMIDTNTNPNILILGRTLKGEAFKIYDARYPKLQWERSVGYFSFNCFLVSFLWYFITICFFHIHRRVNKNI